MIELLKQLLKPKIEYMSMENFNSYQKWLNEQEELKMSIEVEEE